MIQDRVSLTRWLFIRKFVAGATGAVSRHLLFLMSEKVNSWVIRSGAALSIESRYIARTAGKEATMRFKAESVVARRTRSFTLRIADNVVAFLIFVRRRVTSSMGERGSNESSEKRRLDSGALIIKRRSNSFRGHDRVGYRSRAFLRDS